jgi:hypothetical protein
MDAHDIGAMDCIDAMPKRQEAIPALRRRLGRTGSAAVKVQRCSSGGAGQGCSATIRVGAVFLRRGRRDPERLPSRAVCALNNSYFLRMDSACG